MSDLYEKVICHPIFPTVVAALSYTVLAITSAAALYLYFTEIAANDFWHWQLVSYIIMLANGITGFSEFFDEESFLPLRDLLDYCQLALVLPCYAAQMWIKTDMGPPEISAVHAGLGIIATIIYVTTELRRQDLCDLAVFANAVSLFVVGALTMNLFTIIATSVLVAGYYVYKRPDDQCCMAPQDKFNFVMAVFAILSLASFDDNVTRNVQDTLQSIVGAAAN
ncbi:uncharacterized protein LOC109535045 [Dendroctonus ponderosae]